jgi:hypothetical protein
MKKPIELTFQLKFEKLKDEVLVKVWCKDFFAITWMSDENVLKNLVNVESAQGTKIKITKDKDGKTIAIQKYGCLSAASIAKKITKEIQAYGGIKK